MSSDKDEHLSSHNTLQEAEEERDRYAQILRHKDLTKQYGVYAKGIPGHPGAFGVYVHKYSLGKRIDPSLLIRIGTWDSSPHTRYPTNRLWRRKGIILSRLYRSDTQQAGSAYKPVMPCSPCMTSFTDINE